MTNATATEIGQYRPVTRIREGWHVRVLPPLEGGEPEWHAVTNILRVYSPLNFVRIGLADGTSESFTPESEVFCRNTTEVKKTTAR